MKKTTPSVTGPSTLADLKAATYNPRQLGRCSLPRVGRVVQTEDMARSAKRERGRPTVLTPEVADTILTLVRAGNYLEVAAAAAGVARDSLFEWLKRGARERRSVQAGKREKPRKSEQPFVDFSDSLQKARGTSEAADLEVIRRAAVKNWQAAAWRLERKHPQRWGRRERHEITGKDGGPVKSEVAQVQYFHPDKDPVE